MTGSTAAVRLLVAARRVAAIRGRQQPRSPAALAKRLIPDYTVTPTLALISDALVDAIEHPSRKVIISTPPRTGKSMLVSQIGTVFALMRNPDSAVILKSYSDELAEDHSRQARRLIEDSTGLLGFTLDQAKSSAARWLIEARKGGLLAGGVFTSTTGFGAHLLLVDDPVKGAQDADSPSTRRRLSREFKASLLTRRMPGASVVIVMTRWNENDLAAELLAEGGWTHINVPAVSTPGVPDALERDRPGVPMTTALPGEVDFAEIRADVGSRAWAALYLGVPSAPEGGLIQRDWIEQHRVAIAPAHPIRTVVTVDPADSGERDQAGIIAASLTPDGRVHLIANRSGKMTSDEWARAAIALALDVGASEIHVEAFAAGTTYTRLVRETLARTETGRPISVRAWPPKGHPRKGDAVARATPMLQALETGRCVVAGELAELVDSMTRWQAGQHQPDPVAAATTAFDVLAPRAGAQIALAGPLDTDPNRQPPPYLTRTVSGPDRSLIEQRTKPPTQPNRGKLARSVRGGDGYNPMATPRRTIRP